MENVYGAVPPVALAAIDPLDNPLQAAVGVPTGTTAAG